MKRPIAFVFGAGASNAAAQVGMLRALEEFEVRPDLVVGSSAGAINAAAVARYGHEASMMLDSLWRSATRKDFLKAARSERLKNVLRREFLFSQDGLRQMFERHYPIDQKIEDLSIRFAAVATNLSTGSPVIISSGPLLHALAATCAIPGYLEPARSEAGDVLVDGYLTARLPVLQAAELGAGTVIALDCSSRVRGPPNLNVRKVLIAAFDSAMKTQVDLAVALTRTQCNVIHFQLTDTTILRGFDFTGAEKLIAQGYICATDTLTKVKCAD